MQSNIGEEDKIIEELEKTLQRMQQSKNDPDLSTDSKSNSSQSVKSNSTSSIEINRDKIYEIIEDEK